jgi:hypothetical protein
VSDIADLQDSTDANMAADHLLASMPPETLGSFGLFVYVDKATSGPLAQRMYVFDKDENGNLKPLYDWPVSTGRGGIERDVHGNLQLSDTPRGFFELDPKRLYEDHVSGQWNEAMPYAMFFDWRPHGHATGLAIHGTPDENTPDLGTAASAGCVRLSIDHAQTLFSLVRSQYRAPVPKLAYLDGEDGVSSEGALTHDKNGSLKVADGYAVLVLIDGFGDEGYVASR